MPLFVLAHLSHHLVTALPVPLLPYIRDEFALDYTRAGFIISAFGVAYGICQLPAGWLADRFGPRILLTIGIVGVGAAGLLVGLSPNYLILLAALVLMGIMGGGYHPASTTMISSVVKPGKRGQALGFHLVGGSFSYFLAPLIAAGIAVAWNWRGPFIAMAILSIGIGIILHVMLRKRMSTRKTMTRDTSVEPETPFSPGNKRRLITVIVLSAFTMALVMSVLSFIPLFLVDTFGTSKEAAAASMALVFAMAFWAGPLAGYLSDRFGRMAIIITTCVMAGIVVYLLNIVPYGFGIYVLLAAIGTVTSFSTIVAQAYIVDHTPAKHLSTVLGFYFFGNMEGNGVLTPALGYLIDHLGFHTSFTISSAAIIVALVVCSSILWLSRR
ncbi:MAG: MFS transporter [Dehalococcoidia bacterium]|nr:MFS transporter [Dehalococcoidia bacterium]